MRTVPRGSVRASLALAILLAIVLSWVLSGGKANYINYLHMRAIHREMMRRPDIYPRPLPEPRFGWLELLGGRPPMPMERRPGPPPGPALRLLRPPMAPPPGPQRRPPRFWLEVRWLLVRLAVALALAAAAAVWLGRRFTNPLTELAKGADAFQSGNFAHRIPAVGSNEFAAVAAAMNEMARRVSEQIDSLERDAERRRRFLADIAHELRSPVTTMRTMAGALQDGLAEDPERRERAVSALALASERLLRLVQDLMELAKLDLDELPLNVAKTNLRELASAAIRSHEEEARAAGVALRPMADGPSIEASVDSDRISQVLDNLLENAISYSGQGSEVSVLLEDGDPICISIADTGRGIRAEDLPYVTDSFYRADSARTPGERHSGLGLSIARRLVEAHGGQLTISSEEDKGTTVTITIPKEHSQETLPQ